MQACSSENRVHSRHTSDMSQLMPCDSIASNSKNNEILNNPATMVAILVKTSDEKTIDLEILHPSTPITYASAWVKNRWKLMNKLDRCRFSVAFPSVIIAPVYFAILTDDCQALFSISQLKTGFPFTCNLLSVIQPFVEYAQTQTSHLKSYESSKNGTSTQPAKENNESVRFTRSMTAGKTISNSESIKKTPRIKSYAETSLPKNMKLKKSGIPDAGRGVFAKEEIPSNHRFGPYEGMCREQSETESNENAAYTWEVFENGKVKHCIDGSDENKSNWMRFINCARNEAEQNLYAFQYQNDVFYRTNKPIPIGTELLVWYGNRYGKDLGIEMAHDKDITHGFFCKACSLSFNTRYRLYCHFKLCKKAHENPLVNLTELPSGMMLRQFSSNYERPKACSICGYLNDKAHRLSSHIVNCHPEAETYMCEYCGKIFGIKYSLVLHRRTHFNNGSLECPLCGIHCKSRLKLHGHIGKHTGGRLFFCNGCSQISTHDRIEEVLTLCNAQEENPIVYNCDYCSKGYTIEELFATHYAKYDSLVRRHQCEECGERFEYNTKLVNHKKSHHCEETFLGICKICDKSFTTKKGLSFHNLQFHSSSNKIIHCCDLCDKTYHSKSKLKEHYTIHTGEKQYVCIVCGKSFRKDTAMKRHKRVHTGEQPHTCDVCGKSFSQICSLTRHKRIHSGEKPYKCNLCIAAFRQGCLLKNHKRRYHEDETEDEQE